MMFYHFLQVDIHEGFLPVQILYCCQSFCSAILYSESVRQLLNHHQQRKCLRCGSIGAECEKDDLGDVDREKERLNRDLAVTHQRCKEPHLDGIHHQAYRAHHDQEEEGGVHGQLE